jgi:hypothetical protein
MAQLRERYHFIHNVFAHFFKDILDWFSVTLYPRFEYRVVGTYDKSVEYLQKVCQYNRETDKPVFPALILNPSGEFSPADAIAGGRQLWRYPNLAPSFVKRLYDPIYRDANTLVSPGFLRVKGEVELIMLLNSFYEYCDVRLLFINMFGGLDRIIYPMFFTSFIILPDSFINYRYKNPHTGVNYKIDWYSANASKHLVRSTARNELVLPLKIKPQISLTGISDGSTKYGGAERMPDWRLLATINYELEIPNYLIIESDYLVENIDVEIRAGSAFSENSAFGIEPPEERILIRSHWDWGLDETSNSQLVLDPDSISPIDIDSTSSVGVFDEGTYTFNTRYFHIVTQSEVDSTSNLEISLPETITSQKFLLVYTKNGELDYIDDYYLEDNGDILIIRHDVVDLEVDMIIELFIYTRA